MYGNVAAAERKPWPPGRALRGIFWARALRDFGDGLVAVLLPAYLTALGFSALQIGIIATASLLGSATLTLATGLLGSRMPLSRLLIAAASLMVATGLAFALIDAYALLVVVAFSGTVNPSAGSASLFAPLEHALLAGRVADCERTEAFARYGLIGALAGAFGALAAGIPQLLAGSGLPLLAALKAMFVAYAALGALSAAIYARLAPAARSWSPPPQPAIGPSRVLIVKLAALFSLDAFAGGLVVQSLLALWLFERFDLSLSAASVFFFWSGLLAASSFPVAAWLSRRIGLVNTMVFTHVPSNVCLMLAALAPSLTTACVLLLVRAALSQMDVPTRASYVMALVTPAERAAAASLTSVPRSLAAALSPALAGALFAASFRALPLLLCGSLKLVYDLLLLIQFRHLKAPEERGR